MARAGIYKSEVLRARDRLLANGRYPSIDAVREELGNTGSKGTIHRYLKEIEEEEGPATGSRVAVSEAIQDLVGRLAARVNEEAEERVTTSQARHAEQLSQFALGYLRVLLNGTQNLELDLLFRGHRDLELPNNWSLKNEHELYPHKNHGSNKIGWLYEEESCVLKTATYKALSCMRRRPPCTRNTARS